MLKILWSVSTLLLSCIPHDNAGTFALTSRFLDQDFFPEDVAILPKKLQFVDLNAQSMDCLNALLQKQERHEIEEIDFDSGRTVGYDNAENALKTQEEVIHTIATRCPKLKYLCRFSREYIPPFSLLRIAQR